ncbi:NYN domain-containing protein [Escherichia coli]
MRTMVFVDYWNLQLSLQHEDALAQSLDAAALQQHRFQIDWFSLGSKITELAKQLASPDPASPLPFQFQEMRVYTSNNPSDNGSYKQWATRTLGQKPGVRVFCLDRKPKRNPTCPHCHVVMDVCPTCRQQINATQEKGVDTLLVTDLLRLGLDNSYDVAILVSQDSDMAPAAEHLASKGIKVIHAGIKHFGNGVGQQCWASFDLFAHRARLQR